MGHSRSVLMIVNTVASANRFLDVIALFDSDTRVQLFFTTPPRTTMPDGVAHALSTLGVLTLPWHEVLRSRFDLAITANHSGNLHKVAAPVMVISHGVGYTKRPANGPAYGLSPEWLLHRGKLVADTLVLTHTEQLDRLASAVPKAVPAAVVAGDPCYDRMIASADRRPRYRQALGCAEDTRLIVASSTWREGSAFDSWPTFLRQLMAETSPDRHRVAAILHPHVWQEHSEYGIRSWLADCVRAGLILIPPLEGWRAAVIAADVVVGDHGAVTCYAAALGKPVALSAFDRDEVVAGTSAALLGELAPHIDRNAPLLPQLDACHASDEVRELVSSFPGQAAQLHRELFYRKLGLSEPDSGVVEEILSAEGLQVGSGPQAFAVSAEIGTDDVVHLRRRAADVRPRMDGEFHLVVHADHPVRSLRTNADISFSASPDPTLRASNLISVSTTTGVARVRDQHSSRITGGDPIIGASALYAWLTAKGSLPDVLLVDVDGRRYRFELPSLP